MKLDLGLPRKVKKMENNLLTLKDGESAVITSVCHPDEEMKRRLFDLGFYPGTQVKRVLSSPKGDPLAYRVRGTTIALRNSDAQHILIGEVLQSDRGKTD